MRHTAEQIMARAKGGDRWAMQAVDAARTIAHTYDGDYDAGWPEVQSCRLRIQNAAPRRGEARRLVSLVAESR